MVAPLLHPQDPQDHAETLHAHQADGRAACQSMSICATFISLTPQKVADHIQTEYSRTAVIAHISQATKGQQEGWGRPGTKWENQHFRTYISSTLPDMRAALAPKSTAPAHVLWPLSDAAAEQGDEKGAFRAFVQTYVEMIEKARYSRREPTESEAAACEKLVNVILLT